MFKVEQGSFNNIEVVLENLLANWFDINIHGHWYFEDGNYFFEDEGDAVLFKLTFGGPPAFSGHE